MARAGPTRSGTLDGDLIIYGRGDPTINVRLGGGSIHAALQPLVSALTNAGVKRINGDVVGDESYFRGPPFGSGWAWDDMEYYYGAEISALTINDNTLMASVKPGARAGRAMPALRLHPPRRGSPSATAPRRLPRAARAGCISTTRCART